MREPLSRSMDLPLRLPTARGFIADSWSGAAVGVVVVVDLGTAGRRVATVVEVRNGAVRGNFLEPLDAAELAFARGNGRIVDVADRDTAGGKAGYDRWPRPLRAALIAGGAAALWGLVALALR